jgi:hypothetical protein
MKNKIGYIPIENYRTYKPKVCEAPRHQGARIVAYAALAVIADDYPDGLVLMICKDCWDHFDKDMESPKWNLIEISEETPMRKSQDEIKKLLIEEKLL